MAPAKAAHERLTINSKPSLETRVTYSVCDDADDMLRDVDEIRTKNFDGDSERFGRLGTRFAFALEEECGAANSHLFNFLSFPLLHPHLLSCYI